MVGILQGATGGANLFPAAPSAQSVLLDQVFFNLNAAKFEEFTALLDAPPQPNPGLERLLAVKAPWKAAGA